MLWITVDLSITLRIIMKTKLRMKSRRAKKCLKITLWFNQRASSPCPVKKILSRKNTRKIKRWSMSGESR